LIAELSQRGYLTFDEAARVILDEGIAQGKTVAQLRQDEHEFQIAVLERKEQVERQHDAAVVTFFDRGMHDTIAYFRYYGWDVTAELTARMQASTYGAVFLLDMLDNYEQDYARTEDKDFADALTGLLYDAYHGAGQPVVRVPVMPVAERASFIIDYIQKHRQETQ
jgi:predicted ATPase